MFVCVCVYICTQSCPTLHDPMDSSPPGSSVHGILQERILEWIAISFSRGSSWTRDRSRVSFVFCFGRWILYHSVQFSCSVVSDSLRPHGPQHARHPCPSLTPGACSNSCPSSRWCHPTISSSVVPFSSCLQSFPASGFFQMSQFFTSGGHSFGVSASTSVLPMNIQDWSPLGWTDWLFFGLVGGYFWLSWGGGWRVFWRKGETEWRSPSNVSLEGRGVRFQPGMKSRASVSTHSPVEAKTPSQSPLKEAAMEVGTILFSEPWRPEYLFFFSF